MKATHRLTTVYFSPKHPEGVKRGNSIQTMPDKGWWVILRLSAPLRTVLHQDLAPEPRDRVGEVAQSYQSHKGFVQ